MSTTTKPISLRAPETDIPFKEFTSMLGRQKWTVLIVLLVCLALAGAGILLTEPGYQSITRIWISGKTQQFPSIDRSPLDPVSMVRSEADFADVPTAVEELQSDGLVIKAMVALNRPPPPEEPGGILDPSVTVRQLGFTNLLDILVTSSSKDIATQVADQLPKEYAQQEAQSAQNTVQQDADFVQGKIADQLAKVAVADKALSDYRIKHNVTEPQVDDSAKVQDQSRAQEDYENAQSQMAGANVYLDALRAVRRSVPDTRWVDNSQTPTDERSRLQGQISDLDSQRASLLTMWSADAQPVQDVVHQIAQKKKDLAALPTSRPNKIQQLNPNAEYYDQQITLALGQYRSALAQVARRKAELEQANTRLATLNTSEKEFQTLTRSQTDETATLQQLRNEMAELSLRLHQNLAPTNITVVTPPTPPVQVRPRWLLILAIGLVVGLILAIPFATIKDRYDDAVSTVEMGEQLAGALPLGHIPSLRGSASKLANTETPAFESFRIVRSNVLFSAVDRAMESLLVTSTSAGEGKSEVAYNLAVAMALDGRKVVLVDANLRRPSLHTRLKVGREGGLTDVLTGKNTPDEAIHPTSTEGLFAMTAGTTVTSSAELLGSAAMHTLLQDLKEKYSLVIVDGPSAVPNADAQILASLTDQTLFVVRLNKTRKAAMRYAIDLLRQAHTNIIGLVFNRTATRGENVPYTYRRL